MTLPHAERPILVVDDERNIRRTLRMVLEGEGYDVVDAGSATEAVQLLGTVPADLVLLDVKLGDGDGIELLERLKQGTIGGGADGTRADVPVIMISGHANVADAVRATRVGAFDFLEKPLTRDTLILRVRNALERSAMTRQVADLRAVVEGRYEMIGASPIMQDLFRQIAKVAPTKGRVLITGESGTGKELIARAIHQASGSPGEFVKVNCAAIPPELIESELFGHERGSFTGAVGKKRGLFEVADGGTMFLDEIGDMSLSAQAKVLRVLQTGELSRVGGEKVLKVDCRVLAATNKALDREVTTGRFREDLFFRLNVIPLHSPALRDRTEDIPILAEAFVKQCCAENGFRPKRLSPAVIERLRAHPWPGNVRELRNVIERLVIMSEDEITERDLPPYLVTTPLAAAPVAARAGADSPAGSALGPEGPAEDVSPDAAPQAPATPAPGQPQPHDSADLRRYAHLTLRDFRDAVEREFIKLKLKEFDWNISRTAQALQIERTNLHKRLRALGIERDT